MVPKILRYSQHDVTVHINDKLITLNMMRDLNGGGDLSFVPWGFL